MILDGTELSDEERARRFGSKWGGGREGGRKGGKERGRERKE